jgi:hypothetical protein
VFEPIAASILECSGGGNKTRPGARVIEHCLYERPALLTGNAQSIQVSRETIVKATKVVEFCVGSGRQARADSVQNRGILGVLSHDAGDRIRGG